MISIRHRTRISCFVRRILPGARSMRFGAVGAVAGWILLVITSCDLRTVSSSLENLDESAYHIVEAGKSGTLYLRVPWPSGASDRALPGGGVTEIPPGRSGGIWREQVTLVGSPLWREPQEYWYSWFWLHLLAIDRDYLPDPQAMRSQGVESLFVVATRDPSTKVRDVYTSYYPPRVAGRVDAALSGGTSYMSFGFFLRALLSDTAVIGNVIRGGPADLVGLMRDDRILDVDGSPIDTILKHLDNTKSTTHVFRIFRPSTNRTFTRQLSSGQCGYPSVWADTLPGGIGYVAITQFVSTKGATTDDLFRAAIAEMNRLRRNKNAWILDLRGNGGGTIISAQGVAGALLGPEQPLVRVHERIIDTLTLLGRTVDDILYSPSKEPSILPEGKIHFLQDRGTASASEILLSSLRENIPTQVVSYGDSSHGKGIGQLYKPTPLGAYAAITCMHIDPVNAPRYHHVGIAPDIRTTSDNALVRAYADIASAGIPGARGVSGRSLSGIALVDRWNRLEASPPMVPPPLKSSPIPGSSEIW